MSTADLWQLAKSFQEGARMMVGVPSYETYLAHMAKTHPDTPVMSYGEFFRNRQDARFGGGNNSGFRCC